MFSLPSENWLRLVVWLVVGLVIYFGYGWRHSVMNSRDEAPAPGAPAVAPAVD